MVHPPHPAQRTLSFEIEIRATPEQVFAFHTHPANLLRITPRHVRVRILRHDPLRAGAAVELEVRPLPLVRQRWEMRFDVVDAPRRLEDVQVRGPFRAWRQIREFEPTERGCLLRDRVTYALPFGVFGRIADMLVMRHVIRSMFVHRQRATRELIEHDRASSAFVGEREIR